MTQTALSYGCEDDSILEHIAQAWCRRYSFKFDFQQWPAILEGARRDLAAAYEKSGRLPYSEWKQKHEREKKEKGGSYSRERNICATSQHPNKAQSRTGKSSLHKPPRKVRSDEGKGRKMEKVVELHLRGFLDHQIAKKLKIHRSTVSHQLRKTQRLGHAVHQRGVSFRPAVDRVQRQAAARGRPEDGVRRASF
jgi:hypothetical protein